MAQINPDDLINFENGTKPQDAEFNANFEKLRTEHNENDDRITDIEDNNIVIEAKFTNVNNSLNSLGASLNAIDVKVDTKTTGAASSTDNAIPRFNSTTGKLIQNSGVIIDDSNNISGVGTLACGTITSSGDLTIDKISL